MEIGLVDSGGREHALAKALSRNPSLDILFVVVSSANPGIAPLTLHITIGMNLCKGGER